MEPIRFAFLNDSDIDQLELSDTEVLDAVEQGLRAQGLGQTVSNRESTSCPIPRSTVISTSPAVMSPRSGRPESRS
jgi:hypothetical protein